MICSDPNGSSSCLLNASVFLWNCGTLETGANRGVFDQLFDPLVFENFSKFTTKRAKMTVKE